MDHWNDMEEDSSGVLELVDGLAGILGSALSFLVFASAISWISEKLKQLFRTN